MSASLHKRFSFAAVLLFFPFQFLFAGHVFEEVWAYVMKGEESSLRPDMPITDVAYFCVRINEVGVIAKTMDQELLRKNMPPSARVHCVVACAHNSSLLYWCLSRDKEIKAKLLSDIVALSHAFDGIQIDFESVRPQEKEAFISFLEELRLKLSLEKTLSVALLPRTSDANDAYPYARIGKIVDRVLIMAYDEHWRTGSPGTIASVNWCKKIVSFAQKTIPKSKLVMGIPLYGRVWQKEEIARSLKYPQTLELWKQVQALVEREEDGTPHFEFKKTVTASVFYEDLVSLNQKLSCYHDLGIQAVGFWRLSQEPAALWKHIQIENH